MAGIRDDSAGTYGQWTNPQDQSWLDYLGMKAADVGGGAYNALANITGGLSPIGTSEQGNMALQVPPMITGLYDSAKRIGERGGFTRVEEFDAPLKQDLSNALLTFYGGNALAGLSKPRGALGAGAMREAEQLGLDLPAPAPKPMRAYRGSPSPNDLEYTKQSGKFWASSDPDVASIYTQITPYNEHHFMKPGVPFQPTLRTVDMEFANPMTIDAGGAAFDRVPFGGSKSTADALAEIAQQRGHDGLVLNNVHDGVKVANTYAAVKPGTVRSAKTGQIVFSDNKPSVLGAALATAGEQPVRAYRGATNAGNIARDDASILWGSSSPDVASTYARPHFTNYDIEGAVAPLDMDFRNPMTVNANGKHWADLEHGGQRYTADDLADLAKSQGHDGLVVKNVVDTKSWYPGEPRTMPADTYVALKRGTVKSPLTGETLFSDNKPSLLGAALATAGEQPKGITAYHGSPHDFDKFSLDAIGTGEGAQAYGHGLYFADSEGVARSYRDALKKDSKLNSATDRYKHLELDGQPIHKQYDIDASYVDEIKSAIAQGQDVAPILSQKLSRWQEMAQDASYPFPDYANDKVTAYYGLIQRLNEGGQIRDGGAGRMYQVRINADPESFLDWDKPLSQQPESVRRAWEGIAKSPDTEQIAKDFYSYKPGMTLGDLPEFSDPYGSTIYRQTPGAVESATAKLREAGIPGIRYLDGNSRGSGAGSSNYVVFDDSLIEILKKYGMAGGAVGGGALAQPDQASAQDLPDWLKF